MSYICFKMLPIARNVSPKFWKSLSRTGFQRNYWRRRDNFSELSGAVQSLENYMKEVDKEIDRLFSDIQRFSPVKLSRFPIPFQMSRVREIPVVSTDKEGRSYKLELEMQGMEPENINITLRDNEMTITARRDEKRDDGSRFVRENSYHYTLPSEINPGTIRSSLSNGILTIEAPLPALESKEIKVNIESDQKSSDSDSDSRK